MKKMMMMKMTVLMLLAIGLMAVSVSAAIVVDDGFDDGDRFDGIDALDAAWLKVQERNPGDQTLTVKTDDGSPGIGSGNALEVTQKDDDDRRSLLANFADVSLTNIGDSISLSFDLRILSSSNSKEDFRFGLLNNNGSVQTSDQLVDDIVDDDTGYYVRGSTGTETEWSLVYDQGPTSFMAGDMSQLLADQQLGGLDNNSHNIKMTVTRTDEGVDFDFIMDEGLEGEVSMSENHAGDSVVTTFNEIGFSSNDDDINYIIDNVIVEFAEKPEPIADAGNDKFVWLADATAGVDLVGLIVNYNPLKTYTYTWSGEGVSFSEPVTVVDTSCPTTATFTETGTYTLTLEAVNSFGPDSDTVTVTVLDPAITNVQSGHWNLDEGTGNIVADSSTGPFDHSGTVETPGWQAGWVACGGISLGFDGEPNSVVAFIADTGPSDPNGNLDNLQYGITVAAWVNTAPNGSQRVLIKDDAFELRIQSDGTVRLKIWTARADYNMTDSDESELGADLNIADGKWHHVAGTCSVVDEMSAIYIDGVLIHSEEHNEPIWIAESDIDPNMYMGQDYVGGIDDVQLYSYALDSTEIAAIAAMGDTCPVVNAGPDEDYLISNIPLAMQGSVADVSSIPTIVEWSVIQGNPDSVTFADITDPATTVEFDPADPGIFVLQLSATDTLCGEEVVVTNTVTITTILPTCDDVIADGLASYFDVAGGPEVDGQPSPDCYVNLLDFVEFAKAWLECVNPADTTCTWAWE